MNIVTLVILHFLSLCLPKSKGIGLKSDCINISVQLDEGFSGTNFNRPGVQSLLEDARNEKFDCVVVKDFSRFGRSYIEVGSYLEQIFPFWEFVLFLLTIVMIVTIIKKMF